MNTRQANFIGDVRDVCQQAMDLYGKIYNLRESFMEEFSTGKDNDLSLLVDELADWGLNYDALVETCNQFFRGYTNFWEGADIATRQYGKSARRVASD